MNIDIACFAFDGKNDTMGHVSEYAIAEYICESARKRADAKLGSHAALAVHDMI